MKKNVKPKYVDGFVLAVPKNKINAYLRLARMCGKIWLEHGALEYSEVRRIPLEGNDGKSISQK